MGGNEMIHSKEYIAGQFVCNKNVHRRREYNYAAKSVEPFYKTLNSAAKNNYLETKLKKGIVFPIDFQPIFLMLSINIIISHDRDFSKEEIGNVDVGERIFFDDCCKNCRNLKSSDRSPLSANRALPQCSTMRDTAANNNYGAD